MFLKSLCLGPLTSLAQLKQSLVERIKLACVSPLRSLQAIGLPDWGNQCDAKQKVKFVTFTRDQDREAALRRGCRGGGRSLQMC